MITADCGDGNNYRSRLWKSELQELANELHLEISVCQIIIFYSALSLSKDNLGNKVMLTVVMEKGVAFYAKELNAPLNGFVVISVSMVDQVLDASVMDLSNTEGLSESNYEVLRQLGAVGEAVNPGKPLESEPQAKDSEKMRGLQ